MIKNKFVNAYLLTGTLFKVKQMKEKWPSKRKPRNSGEEYIETLKIKQCLLAYEVELTRIWTFKTIVILCWVIIAFFYPLVSSR